MKNARKLIGGIIFVLIAVLLIVPVSYMLRPMDNGSNIANRKRFIGLYTEPEDSINIITLGSSAAFYYVNTMELWKNKQWTSYNLCSPDQPIFTAPYLIDEVLKTQDPELIILETRQFLFPENDQLETTRFKMVVDNMKYSWNRLKMINDLIENPLDRIEYYFDIVAYHSHWESLGYDSLEYADNEKEHPLKGWINYNKYNEIELTDVSQIKDTHPISEIAEGALRNVIQKCKDRDVEILFLASPWQIDEQQKKQNNYMKEIVEEQGYHFLDFNDMIEETGLDTKVDFVNKSHVNVFGSRKFSAVLMDYIAENYEISTDHSEEVVESWNAAAGLYDQKMVKFQKEYNQKLKEAYGEAALIQEEK